MQSLDQLTTPSSRRWIAMAGGLLFSGYGIASVSVHRGIGTERGIDIAWWWYLLASGVPMLVLVVASCTPANRACWQHGRMCTAMLWALVITQLYIPLLYTACGLE